jgi:hypothetical protein
MALYVVVVRGNWSLAFSYKQRRARAALAPDFHGHPFSRQSIQRTHRAAASAFELCQIVNKCDAKPKAQGSA